MSIKAKCIDASNRPEVIPLNKWVKEEQIYEIVWTTLVLPQKQIGVHLAEIDLTENELPYQYFLLNRFAIREEDIKKLIELIEDCNKTHFDINELLKQTQTIEV